MPPVFSAIFMAGPSDRRHEVTVTLAPAGLRIEGIADGPARLWPYDDIRLAERTNSDRPVQLSLTGARGVQLSVADPAFGPEIAARLAPHAIAHRAPRPNMRGIALIATGVAVLALAIGIAVPRMAHWLAPLIPIA